jgi:hypothetical protein
MPVKAPIPVLTVHGQIASRGGADAGFCADDIEVTQLSQEKVGSLRPRSAQKQCEAHAVTLINI